MTQSALGPPLNNLDPRVTLCDLEASNQTLRGVADASLRERLGVYARKRGLTLEVAFPTSELRQVAAGRTPLYRNPSFGSEAVSEVGFGETVRAYDARGGFTRVAAERDGYLGWVPDEALGTLTAPTHRFVGLRGHVYGGPEVSARRLLELGYGAPLTVQDEADGWAQVALADGMGFVKALALEPLGTEPQPTPEAVTRFALRFLETPYVWGGMSAWGLDCSGLAQTVLGAFGVPLPRDADQQEACGREVSPDEVRAADLLFFPGHVDLALDRDRFVHANAHHMKVSVDSFSADPYGWLRQELTRAVRVLP